MQKINKIKVLQLVEDFKTGGLENVVKNIYERLPKRKYETWIWCLAGGGEMANNLIRNDENIEILGLKTYHNPLNIIRLACLIRKQNFHLVHTHGYFAGTMGRIAAFLARTPVIISHVHTTYWNFSKRNYFTEKALSRISDCIVCCSNAVRDFVTHKEGIDSQKTVTVYNGISCEQQKFSPFDKKENNKYDINISITASLVTNKGHKYLFEALPKLSSIGKKIRLTVIGDGPLKKELNNYAKELGIEEKIDFLGKIDNVNSVIKNTDIFVLPSIEREGLSVSVIEALCHSLPVVASNIGGLPELIEDGVNGFLVNPKDPDALAEKIKILVTDKNKRKKMGREGKRKFSKKFDVKGMIQRIDELYTSLLDKKNIGKVHILYIHNNLNIGGGEQSLINLWKNLDKEKYSLHLLIPEKGIFSQEAKKTGVKVDYLYVPGFRFYNVIKILKTLFLLGCYCTKNKINIIHSYAPRNNILSALLGKIMRIPVIWHERNLIFENESDMTRKFLSLPDRIICNSQAIAERFRKKRGIPSKVKVVLNGVDLSDFRPGKARHEILNKYKIAGKQIAGLVSNLGKRKKPEYLFNSCPSIIKKCPETTFVIVGGEFSKEDHDRKKQLERKAKSLGLEKYFVFTGFVSNVGDLIRTFDIGLAVTENEACSRAILEMMACGKPVVAFDTGGNSELIEDGITGKLVPFPNFREFAEAVVELLEDDKKREAMGRNARERAEKMFDAKTNAYETEKIYDALLKKNTVERER